MALSATTSTAVPPCPKRITGPKVGSMLAPMISSCACFIFTIFCTVKPSTRALGWLLPTRTSMACAAARTSPSSFRFSTTPPTSDLCEMSSERILSTTGKPMRAASAAAASASAGTVRVATTGMWYASHTALASGSVSMSRPLASTLCIRARTRATSGVLPLCNCAAGGASLSSARLRA